MDGKALLYALEQKLLESSDSDFIDDRTSYNYLFEAAVEFVSRTECLQTTQSITTVADQAAYDLEADYIGLWWKNKDRKHFIKLNDGSTNYFIHWRDYGELVYGDQSDTSVTIPDYFSVITNTSLPDQVTGSATSAGAKTGGQCTLTSTSGDFTDVRAGDIVHNTTDGSDGVVLSKTSSTVLVTALFGGTNDDWSGDDDYIIQPQSRAQITFDPPPSTADYTVTVPYIQRPAPVYSDYGVYPIPIEHHPLLVEYAAWKYKYRDSKPNFGDAYWTQWDTGVRRAIGRLKKNFNRNPIKISWKAQRN